MDNLDNYRIRRSDPKNIVIERRVETKEGSESWAIISYYGNSAKSLISGLFDLMIATTIPEDKNLLDALETIQLELVSGMDKIEKLIREGDYG